MPPDKDVGTWYVEFPDKGENMKTLPLADMRGVKFNSIENKYSRRVGDLCERCGIYDSCDSSSQRSNELDVDIVVSECKIFHPILMFVNPKGTDDEFTTIRLGEAWVKRVEEDSVISLFNKKEGSYGKAVVTGVSSGFKSFVIYKSIHTNHMMLDFEGDQDDRLKVLSKIVKNAYGNLIWKNNDKATIIEMKRIE